MTRLPRSISLIVVACATLFLQNSTAQLAMSPSDPVVEYNSATPPATPGWFNRIVKWVRTKNIAGGAVQSRNPGWNSDVYKSYAYGINSTPLAFRLEFPRTYTTANDGRKYPLILFLHGQGENDYLYKSPNSANYDNQYQLLQGPPEFDAAIQNGTYDGFVLAPQLQDPYPSGRAVFYDGVMRDIMTIVDSLITNYKVDPFQIIVNGLSEGGLANWTILDQYPTYFAGVTPMSSPVDFVDWSNTGTYFNRKKYTSIWTSQGGLDTHPSPSETQRIADTMAKYGGNFKLAYFPNNLHDTWYSFWQQPGFWPFVNRVYSSNPWPLFAKSKFWTGQPVNTTLGLTAGFDAYEWRRNGIIIPTASSNELLVTLPGIYDARVRKNTVWSEWSRIPVNVSSLSTYRKQAEDWANMSGVQTENTLDAGGGLNVGWIDRNDWMDYTLGVGDTTAMPAPYFPGTYTVSLRVAAVSAGAQFQIRNSDSTVLATVNVPATGGWQTWQTVSVDFPLVSGKQNIRIKSISATGFNINWMDFTMKSVQGVLPVKFIYFNAQCKNGGVALQWKTAQEINSKEFEVQRSSDGTNWSVVGRISAAGQSSIERSYEYLDNAVSSSNNFYRIAEYDLDGRTTISSVVRGNCTSLSRNEFSVAPNPSMGSSALNVSLERATKIALTIVDSKGALMQQSQVMLPQGSSSLPLNMNNYSPGIYNINIRYNNEMKTIKVLKK